MSTFHDHGTWRGPCSKERHAAIASDAKSFFLWVIRVEGEYLCLCCRQPLTPGFELYDGCAY